MDFDWILNTPLQKQAIQKMSMPLIGMSNVLHVRLGIVSQEMQLIHRCITCIWTCNGEDLQFLTVIIISQMLVTAYTNHWCRLASYFITIQTVLKPLYFALNTCYYQTSYNI